MHNQSYTLSILNSIRASKSIVDIRSVNLKSNKRRRRMKIRKIPNRKITLLLSKFFQIVWGYPCYFELLFRINEIIIISEQRNYCPPRYIMLHGLRTPRDEIAFTARRKFTLTPKFLGKYGRSIFCLPHQPNFSDIFDLCLHWVSIRSPWVETSYQNVWKDRELHKCWKQFPTSSSAAKGDILI